MDWDPATVVAAWTAAGVMGAALITGVFGLLSTRRRLGKPNGHGDISTMLAKTLTALGGLEERLADHAAEDRRVQREIFDRLEAMKR